MTSPRLAQIARQLDRTKKPVQERQPATGDLADAISQLIAEQVEQRVSEHLERQPTGTRLRQLLRQGSSPPPMATDFKELPPTPTTPLPTMQGAIIQRGEDGRCTGVTIGATQLRVQRDDLGRILRLVPADGEPQ